MTEKAFVDTNILVYAYDSSQAQKHQTAKRLLQTLWQSGQGVISAQVLQEFCVSIQRISKGTVVGEELAAIVETYLTWDMVPGDGVAVLEALTFQARYQTSFWDALIIRAANAAKANILYTENLNHEQLYGEVRVINPLL
jgi:predicted nucleic acid-binding protein